MKIVIAIFVFMFAALSVGAAMDFLFDDSRLLAENAVVGGVIGGMIAALAYWKGRDHRSLLLRWNTGLFLAGATFRLMLSSVLGAILMLGALAILVAIAALWLEAKSQRTSPTATR